MFHAKKPLVQLTPSLRDLVRRALLVTVVLFVAACSGGGCSGGCASCGTTPLPGGFPKPQTVPNAAAVRVTRPGLNFVQENIGLLAEKALSTTGAKAGVASFAIPTSGTSPKICSVATPSPLQCNAEIDIGKAKLRVNAITPNRVKIDGLLPIRIRDLPISVTLLFTFNGTVVAGDKSQGQNLCTQNPADVAFKEFPVNIELPLVTENRIPRNGYTKVDVENAVIDIGITKNDLEVCDRTCNGNCQGGFDLAKDLAFSTLIGGVKNQVKTALSSAFCTAPTPTVTPPCPTGSDPDDKDLTKATKCVFSGTTECVPSLLGTDGRMDLSKALINFSPGTKGGLDFVLASAGDMTPAPSEAGPGAWSPRKPPVPAEDNNKNGISLSMLGGALPFPQSKCVTEVFSAVPQGIPVPNELKGDVITPWSLPTGPHVGFALAGRFLDHAAVAAYNSGVLCLGISTEQVDQLSTGYLSILTPSIKLLTFEQAAGSAAITTRPGAPPKIKLGGGTDVKTDPLMTITLPKLAVDFYVFSLDRYVRFFTYTADVTIPVNLQTGKDPKTNPNGGILPVLGDIKLANASVTNAELLLDDPAMVSNGVTGLLGGIVGQFLGGGFKPIDLTSALASFGLAMDIPSGGIRKITSGSDDFLAIFANLTKAAGTAHEEADTRATLVEKVVDRDAMGLASAVRARFPKLRVHAEGIATKPTEQTWWVDNGPHAAWTTARDITVDNDAMLMQGKHVLYVSSRVVSDMASEDNTPAEIPFTIDTLAPLVQGVREGERVTVRARDFVSSESALVARRRVGDAEWSEWAAFSSASSFAAPQNAAVEVDVKDEEGNIGHVSLPLIRGKADSSLAAAGSGCGCRLTGTASGERSGSSGAALALFGGALALALAGVARRRARITRRSAR